MPLFFPSDSSNHIHFSLNYVNSYNSLPQNITMLTIYANKICHKEKKPYLLDIYEIQTGCTLECIEIIKKQSVRNTDGVPCSEHLVCCVGHNLVIRTDVPTAHGTTPISPLTLISSSGQMNNRYLICFLALIETKKKLIYCGYTRVHLFKIWNYLE